MDPLSGRVVAWLIRRAASLLVFAGGALFVAGIPAMSAVSGGARDVLVVILEIAATWIVLGLTAVYVSRQPSTHPGAWRFALALVLALVAAWLVFMAMPFLSEWRTLILFARSSDMLVTANANMSGVLLVPLAAALAPPFIELAAVAAVVASAFLMLVLAVTRSPRFAPLYVATALVIAALVTGSVLGARAARVTAELLQPFIEESKPRPEEYELIRGVFERYTAGVMPTATKLVWAGVGYAVWAPLVLLASRR